MTAIYKQIINDFINKYNKQIIVPGETVPSESEYMREWNCSRDTVRKSMAVLTERKYIKKSQGQKSIILDRNEYEFPVSKITSFTELQKASNLKAKTNVVKFEIVPEDHYIYKKFQVPTSEEILEIIRIRNIDGENIILDKDFFILKYVKGLTEEIANESIYEFLENKLNLKIGFAKKTITIQDYSSEDLEYLDFKEGTLIATISSKTYLEDETLFQFTQSRHRSDKFKFTDYAHR